MHYIHWKKNIAPLLLLWIFLRSDVFLCFHLTYIGSTQKPSFFDVLDSFGLKKPIKEDHPPPRAWFIYHLFSFSNLSGAISEFYGPQSRDPENPKIIAVSKVRQRKVVYTYFAEVSWISTRSTGAGGMYGYSIACFLNPGIAFDFPGFILGISDLKCGEFSHSKSFIWTLNI